MTYLFFDTETTGLPDQRTPPSNATQPHICQLGVIVTDREGRVKAELNALVRPDGWTIPPTASAIHGITQVDAERYGLSTKGVLSIFARLLKASERVVAHNISFDLFMLEIECHRTGVALELPDKFACTMEASVNVVRADGADDREGDDGVQKPEPVGNLPPLFRPRLRRRTRRNGGRAGLPRRVLRAGRAGGLRPGSGGVSTKTLYIRPEHEATWDKAKRLIPLHEGVSLSQHLSGHLEQVVEKYEALPTPDGESLRLLLDTARAFLKRQSFDTEEALKEAIDLVEAKP